MLCKYGRRKYRESENGSGMQGIGIEKNVGKRKIAGRLAAQAYDLRC
jgi:hypothetical protein